MDWQIGLGKGTRGEWSGWLNGWKCILIYPNVCIYGKQALLHPELETVFWDFAVKRSFCGCFGVKKFELTIVSENEAGRWQMLISLSDTDE